MHEGKDAAVGSISWAKGNVGAEPCNDKERHLGSQRWKLVVHMLHQELLEAVASPSAHRSEGGCLRVP